MTLKEAIDSIQTTEIRDCCEELWDHPDHHQFANWPASIRFHHVSRGGLLEHTLEVVEYALHIADKFSQCDRDILIASALWHDFAKIWDYRESTPTEQFMKDFGEFTSAEYQRTVGHVCGSAAEFVKYFKGPMVLRDAIAHAILAHHGPVKEWGSPVAPQTLEAVILHQADMLSAHHGATK